MSKKFREPFTLCTIFCFAEIPCHSMASFILGRYIYLAENKVLYSISWLTVSVPYFFPRVELEMIKLRSQGSRPLAFAILAMLLLPSLIFGRDELSSPHHRHDEHVYSADDDLATFVTKLGFARTPKVGENMKDYFSEMALPTQQLDHKVNHPFGARHDSSIDVEAVHGHVSDDTHLSLTTERNLNVLDKIIDVLDDIPDVYDTFIEALKNLTLSPIPWDPSGNTTIGEACSTHDDCVSGYCKNTTCQAMPDPSLASSGCLVCCEECEEPSRCVVGDKALDLAAECADLNELAYIGGGYNASLRNSTDPISGFSPRQEALLTTGYYEDIDDAVIADDNRTDDICIFAFRGTDTSSYLDFLNNLNFFPTDVCDAYSNINKNESNCCPLMGYAAIAYNLQVYEAELRGRILKCAEKGKQLVFTGHSQGSGAALAASTIFASYKPWTILLSSNPTIWTNKAVGLNCPLYNAENRVLRFANTKVDRYFGGLWYDFLPHMNIFIDKYLAGQDGQDFLSQIVPKPTSGDGPLCMLPPDEDGLDIINEVEILNLPYGDQFDFVAREMACYENPDLIPYSWFGSFLNPNTHFIVSRFG